MWGLSGATGEALALIGTIILLVCCPFVALLTYEQCTSVKRKWQV